MLTSQVCGMTLPYQKTPVPRCFFRFPPLEKDLGESEQVPRITAENASEQLMCYVQLLR